ncbi:MAG: hypothetical protein LUQ20_05080 [Candidatus Methanoperedens sp.]|nr:hypothetical protein [Candidatus Methanoperedens sp.]
MYGTRMFYKLAIEDFTILFGETSKQGNKAKVIFQTGLTGSTGFVSFFDQVYLSIIKDTHINANPVQQICVYLRSSAVNILLITIQLILSLNQCNKHHYPKPLKRGYYGRL